MKISLKQDATYVRANWWKWSVWVEGSKDDLAQIESVEYTLHPSFSHPTQCIEDRRTNFRLDSAGGGEFQIHATVAIKNGRTKRLSHWLELKSPEEEKAQPKAATRGMASAVAPPVIFLCGLISDMPFAQALKKAFAEQGAKVLMIEDQPSELPWEVSLNMLLNQADLAMFIISDVPNTWMKREFEAIRKRKMPFIPILVMNNKVKSSDLPVEMGQAIRIKAVPPDQNDKEAHSIAKRIQSQLNFIMQEARKKRGSKA
jgi:hypothetical protein